MIVDPRTGVKMQQNLVIRIFTTTRHMPQWICLTRFIFLKSPAGAVLYILRSGPPYKVL